MAVKQRPWPCLKLWIMLLVFNSANADNDTKGKILGGSPACECAYPFHLALKRGIGFPTKEATGFYHLGSGALIHPQWAITAASALRGPGEIELPAVFAGGRILSGPYFQVSPTSEVFIHPTWKDRPVLGYGVDIALLKLACPLDLPIVALPEPDFCIEPSTILNGTGFGRKSDGGGYADVLQHVMLSRRRNSECEHLVDSHDVPSHLICIGEKTGGLCAGDVGGPFVVHDGVNRQVLVGISPQSSSHCSREWAVLLTSVTFAMDWIMNTLNNNTDPAMEPHPKCTEMKMGSTTKKYCREEVKNPGKEIVENLVRGAKSQNRAAELISTAATENNQLVLMEAVTEASQVNLLSELARAFILAGESETDVGQVDKAINQLHDLLKEAAEDSSVPGTHTTTYC